MVCCLPSFGMIWAHNSSIESTLISTPIKYNAINRDVGHACSCIFCHCMFTFPLWVFTLWIDIPPPPPPPPMVPLEDKIYQVVWAVLGSVRTAKREQPVCRVIIVRCTKALVSIWRFGYQVTWTLSKADTSKTDSSFGPDVVRFRESWLYSNAKCCPVGHFMASTEILRHRSGCLRPLTLYCWPEEVGQWRLPVCLGWGVLVAVW